MIIGDHVVTASVNGSLPNQNSRKKISASILIGTGAAHAAGDVVSTDAGAILQFDCSALLSAGQSGIILSSVVTLDNNAVFSGGAGYTLYLFSTPPAVQATNAVFDRTVAELPNYIGKIVISTITNQSSTCAITDVGHNKDFTLAVADTKFYGKLVCNGGETTISGKTITINLGIAAL